MGINQRAGRNGGRRQLSWMFSWSCLGVFLEFSSSFSLYFPSDINHQFGSSSAPPAPAPFLTTFLQLSYNCLGTFFSRKAIWTVFSVEFSSREFARSQETGPKDNNVNNLSRTIAEKSDNKRKRIIKSVFFLIEFSRFAGTLNK